MGAKRKYRYVYAHLVAEMDKRGILPEDLAKACGCGISVIYEKLIGRQNFTPRQRQAIGRKLFPYTNSGWLFEKDREAKAFNQELKEAEDARKGMEEEEEKQEAAENLEAFLEGLRAVPGEVGEEARERARQIIEGLLLDADK